MRWWMLGSRSDSRSFIHDQNNPLHLDIRVKDEVSMIDLETMNAFLRPGPGD